LGARSERIAAAGLLVDPELYEFVSTQALPGLGLDADAVWGGMRQLVDETAPRIARALETRAALQAQIDDWHRQRAGKPHDPAGYRAFLESIGYIVSVDDDFSIETDRIDPEISQLAGPQLVVPISNARYSLNAANARWGSLYDAVYGTDVLGSRPEGAGYDEARGALVVAWVRRFLDEIFPLAQGSHRDARAYRVVAGTLVIELAAGTTGLARPSRRTGRRGWNQGRCDRVRRHDDCRF
jgi:malate synthase